MEQKILKTYNKSIDEFAKHHANVLYENLSKKTFNSTIQGVGKYLNQQDWDSLKLFLEMNFMVALERKPITLISITKHEEDVQIYCDYLYKHMKSHE